MSDFDKVLQDQEQNPDCYDFFSKVYLKEWTSQDDLDDESKNHLAECEDCREIFSLFQEANKSYSRQLVVEQSDPNILGRKLKQQISAQIAE
jgi:hypothetical protein